MRIYKNKFFILLFIYYFIFNSNSVLSDQEINPPDLKPDSSVELMISDLRAQKEKNEKFEKDLKEREMNLSIKEKAIDEQVKNLEERNNKFLQLREDDNKNNIKKIQQLTDTVLTMSPKSASALLSTLDDHLAVEIMMKMESPKLAKILNVMNPVRASHLSEKMAGLSKNNDVPSINVEKGGEIDARPTNSKPHQLSTREPIRSNQ